MELVIGGKSQGKLKYILNLYDLKKEDVVSGKLENAFVIDHLESFIYFSLKEGIEPEKDILDFVNCNPNSIFICNEVGCGIVPIDKFERKYRERVGQICCILASMSSKVHRVVSGVGSLIKDE